MNPTTQGRPTLSSVDVAEAVQRVWRIEGSLEPLPAEWDQNFRLIRAGGGDRVVKIANRDLEPGVLELQNAALAHLAGGSVGGVVPHLVPTLAGEDTGTIRDPRRGELPIRMLTWVSGERLASARPLDARTLERVGEALGKLDACLADFEHPAMNRDLPWDLAQCEWISACTSNVAEPGRRRLVEAVLLQYRARVAPRLASLPVGVIHNDANDENLLLSPHPEGGLAVSGLLDFGDMLRSHTVNELAIAAAYALFGAADPVAVVASLATGYHGARPLTEDELRVLFPLTCMRLCVSVTSAAIAAREDPENAHRLISVAPAWEALERLVEIDWRVAEERLRAALGFDPRSVRPFEEHARHGQTLLEARGERLGPSLSLSYDAPLEIVRGRGPFLFDRTGRAHLDCVNNVCHVGHSHPKVVEALAGQAAILNTNTRYLHPAILELADRLCATLPDPLDVCFFVNSGSEANELAIRMARAHTGRRNAVVVDGAYHGNTQTLVDLSPYKCEGPGGQGLADWAWKVPMPDSYRGSHRGSGEEVGRAYAEYVRELCARLAPEGRAPAFFLCEPILGCGGQVVLPDGFLREAFRFVRAAGGVCIADEVQVGMGRVGSHMWAFETQDAVPDVVTVGKPIGNGHPLAAVITTREIAASFDNGMEYFNTFGGNPVSMAVGLAVLDVIEEEGLRERAEDLGRYLTEELLALAEDHRWIGDVRGRGLFMGVELVRDRETLEPAPEETARVIERAKADGVLLSAEGPFHNVLKIKPPLAIEKTDVDLLLGAVDRALSELS